MDTSQGSSGSWKRLMRVTACVVGVSTFAAHGLALAQQTMLAPDSARAFAAAMGPADLEKAFWVCDYTATVAGVQATPVALCAAVWDEIKQPKFGGSFEDLLAWWQSNKAAEHEALATAPVAFRSQD
jgi:hypothetical protein